MTNQDTVYLYAGLALAVLLIVIGLFIFARGRRAKKEEDFGSFSESAPDYVTSPTIELKKYKTPVTLSPWQRVLQKTREKWFAFGGGEAKVNRAQLEEALLGADVGFKSAQTLLDQIDFSKEWSELQRNLADEIAKVFPATSPWPQKKNSPHVILFVGVNGVGKTTSIAKVAREIKSANQSVILAAGDTFRAAAADQLKAWADRLEIPCVMGGAGADSSSVLFDAVKSGVSKGVDFIICDSAGRLHNNDQLMENLAKNKRVLEKALPGAPHDTILVLDANTGQNMLSQGKKFLELGVTGLILTKLDGSAKGGAVIPLVQELKLPIFKVGIGEGEEDMVPFDPKNFAESMVGLDSEAS